MTDSPIEAYLDDMLRTLRADARTTRRLLDEAADHLLSTAAALEDAGVSRHDAEIEAIHRFGPVSPVAAAVYRRSVRALVADTARAAVFLAGCGLLAIGVSGVVALLMNLVAGRSFVGGQTLLSNDSASMAEVADDAVVLRGLAGVVGVALLLAYTWMRRRRRTPAVLPAGLVDALGAAAFAAGSVGLVAACVDQATQTGTRGVGFALSGALISVPAAVVFCLRAIHRLLPPRAS